MPNATRSRNSAAALGSSGPAIERLGERVSHTDTGETGEGGGWGAGERGGEALGVDERRRLAGGVAGRSW